MSDDTPMQIVARVRRAMPRNQDVMAICDELEKRIVAPIVAAVESRIGSPLTRAEIQKNYRQRKKAKSK